jgi:hypothetical protein
MPREKRFCVHLEALWKAGIPGFPDFYSKKSGKYRPDTNQDGSFPVIPVTDKPIIFHTEATETTEF